MNLKEIKDAARQAFSDQQTQDTEGGVPDIISFCAGFLAGVRHRQDEIDQADDLRYEIEQNMLAAQDQNHYYKLMCEFRDKNFALEAELNEVELREVRANRLMVDLARQLTDLQRAFDDRVRVIEMQLEDKKKLEREIEILRQYGNKDCTAMADEVLENE